MSVTRNEAPEILWQPHAARPGYDLEQIEAACRALGLESADAHDQKCLRQYGIDARLSETERWQWSDYASAIHTARGAPTDEDRRNLNRYTVTNRLIEAIQYAEAFFPGDSPAGGALTSALGLVLGIKNEMAARLELENVT